MQTVPSLDVVYTEERGYVTADVAKREVGGCAGVGRADDAREVGRCTLRFQDGPCSPVSLIPPFTPLPPPRHPRAFTSRS
jgi:hypothetical protein